MRTNEVSLHLTDTKATSLRPKAKDGARALEQAFAARGDTVSTLTAASQELLSAFGSAIDALADPSVDTLAEVSDIGRQLGGTKIRTVRDLQSADGQRLDGVASLDNTIWLDKSLSRSPSRLRSVAIEEFAERAFQSIARIEARNGKPLEAADLDGLSKGDFGEEVALRSSGAWSILDEQAAAIVSNDDDRVRLPNGLSGEAAPRARAIFDGLQQDVGRRWSSYMAAVRAGTALTIGASFVKQFIDNNINPAGWGLVAGTVIGATAVAGLGSRFNLYLQDRGIRAYTNAALQAESTRRAANVDAGELRGAFFRVGWGIAGNVIFSAIGNSTVAPIGVMVKALSNSAKGGKVDADKARRGIRKLMASDLPTETKSRILQDFLEMIQVYIGASKAKKLVKQFRNDNSPGDAQQIASIQFRIAANKTAFIERLKKIEQAIEDKFNNARGLSNKEREALQHAYARRNDKLKY